ncbi:hypothetical protein [Bordetella sp. N]|uniref:hypothetical protein n=1 Tax=Bordetella sp. N TaxID=1746199 RepID=UPI000B1D617F|nr:hypothetical protein [Bordetella sp. N]
MSSTAAFASPSALDAESAGLRPLSGIADFRAGGVPQARVCQMLADLLAALAPLHAQGRVHGGISMDTVMRGAADPVRLLDSEGSLVPDGEDTPRYSGFAAFEQYTDDPGSPCGPWTDIYSLSALAYVLITGAAPPDALSRRVRDDYVPLARLAPRGYDAAFLDGLDAGLSMVPALRAQSLDAFDDGLMLPVPTFVAAPVVVAAEEPVVAVEESATVAVAGAALGVEAARVAAAGAPVVAAPAAVAPVAAPAPAATATPVPASRPAPVPKEGAAATPAAAASKTPLPPSGDKSRRASGFGIAFVVAILAVAGFLWFNKGDEPSTKVASTTAASQPAAPPMAASSGQPSTPTAPAGSGASGASPAPAASDTSVAPNAAAGSNAPVASSAAVGANAPAASNAPAAANAPTASPSDAGQPAASTTTPAAGGSSTDLPAAPSASQPVIATSTLNGAKPIPDRRTAPEAATVHDPLATLSTATPAATSTAAPTVAPAAPAPAAPAPATKAPVTVKVNVLPWGEVIVDGKSRGISPPLRELKLPPGKHSVLVKNADLPPYRVTVDLTEGRGASISHSFQ